MSRFINAEGLTLEELLDIYDHAAAYPVMRAAIRDVLYGRIGIHACGCTIHQDRGEPCPNGPRICLVCERDCWGQVERFSRPSCGINNCGREVGHTGEHRPDPGIALPPTDPYLIKPRRESRA